MSNKKVPWAYKMKKEFTRSDKDALAEHLIKLEEKAEDYKKYLINHCRFKHEDFGWAQ